MNPEAAPQAPEPQSTVMPQPISDNKPVVFIVIIIILILGGAFYYFFLSREGNQSNVKQADKSQNNPQSQVKVLSSVTPTITIMDSSDTKLDKDIQSINNKMVILTTDVDNIDQGLKDKPIDSGL